MTDRFLQGIDTVIIRVSDINTSGKWYQDKLGLKTIWEDPSIKLIVLDTHCPTSLTLWQTEQPLKNNPGTAPFPVFKTADAELAWQQLAGKGVNAEPIIADEFVKSFSFFDPDGNQLSICQLHQTEAGF